MARTVILGLDPGFANFGWAVALVGKSDSRKLRIVDLGLITTKKATKKQNVRVSSDQMRRTGELYRALTAVIEKHKPHIICTEGFSPPRSSSVAAMLGRAFGVVTSLAELHLLPVVEVTPQEIKMHLTGSESASKKVIIAKTLELVLLRPHAAESRAKIVPSKLEHPHDAVGAILTGMPSDTVRAVLSARR